MKLRRLFCCLFVFVFIFSVVFLHTVSALDINGYSVVTSYALGDVSLGPLQYTYFTTTINTSSTYNILNINANITLPSPIEENSNLDLTIELDYGIFDSITASYKFIGEDDLPFMYGDVDVIDKKITFNDLKIDGGDLYSIYLNFIINNPSWSTSSGGDVSSDDCSGTWLLNSTLNAPSSSISLGNISGTFNSWNGYACNSFNLYRLQYFTDVDRLILSSDASIYPFAKLEINADGSFYYSYMESASFGSSSGSLSSDHAYAEDFRTVTFNNLHNSDLFQWLSSNATKISSYDLDVASTNYSFKFDIVNIDTVVTEDISGIIGWIQNVVNSITNLPSRIASAISNLFNNISNKLDDLGVNLPSRIASAISSFFSDISNKITDLGNNLPSRIASAISNFFTDLGNNITNLGTTLIDGIKGLFIPSEDDIIELKDKFTSLLEDRFGAVYDSALIIDDFATALYNSAITSTVPGPGGGAEGGIVSGDGTINFPSVTVNLAGTDFTFGGWNVLLKYDGFQPLYDALALITNICATFLFLNSMKHRLESILH